MTKKYTYNGKEVYIAYIDDVKDAAPIATCGLKGIFPAETYNGCDTCLCEDDMIAEGDDLAEIVITDCVNPENDCRLLYGFWRKDYAETDKFNREYCTLTSRSYEWDSELRSMYDRVQDAAKDGEITAEEYEELAAYWDAAIAEGEAGISDGNLGHDEPPTVDDIMKELGIYVEEDRIRVAVRKAMNARGLKNIDVAKALGITPVFYSRFLTGKASLNQNNIARLFKILNIKLIVE